MQSLKQFVDKENEIEIFEQYLFGRNNGVMFANIDIDQTIYNNYNFYKEQIYETLNKTYNHIKFAKYLNENFPEIELISEYSYGKQNIKNNNRLKLISSNININKNSKFISACDLYGFIVAQVKKIDNKLVLALEPIYFNEISTKINKMKYLYHVVRYDNEYKDINTIKKSFDKKDGIKPSKRQRKSNHYRRTYCFTEYCSVNDILGVSQSYNFCLIKIKLKEYLNDFPNRKIEWFEDPNTNNGIWTREMIPYNYLEFFDINNKNKINEILNESN